jgi:hypothetical protein
MNGTVTHIATRECPITQPHPAGECGVVTARRHCQEEGDATKRPPGARWLGGTKAVQWRR